MPPYAVQRGYVTAETSIGRGRASVDFEAGSVLPEDVPAEELAALVASGKVVEVKAMVKTAKAAPKAKRKSGGE